MQIENLQETAYADDAAAPGCAAWHAGHPLLQATTDVDLQDFDMWHYNLVTCGSLLEVIRRMISDATHGECSNEPTRR